jgi:hypothetical protein
MKSKPRRFAYLVLLAGALFGSVAGAQAPIRSVPVHFAKGSSGATLKASLKGDEIVDYTLRAAAGQTMRVSFKPSNASAYFNLLPPDSEAALFIGSTSGNEFSGALPASGVYRIRVYLMRNAARRNESVSYTLDIGVTGAVGDVVTTRDGQ